MLRKSFFATVLIVVLFNIIAGMVPAMAQGPKSVIWAEDFEINVYGWPSEVMAGETFDITINAGSESAGAAASEPVQLWASSGGTITETGSRGWAPNLDATGSVTATLVYTQAGAATMTVSVGVDKVFTYTVAAGDCLQNIAAQHGDRYPEIWERNKAVVGDDPARLSAGQVLEVVRYAPSRILKTTVLATEPAKVEWTSLLDVVAGQTPKVNGVLQDEYGNPTTGVITVTLETESVAMAVKGDFEVSFTSVYTESSLKALKCLTLSVKNATGKLLTEQAFCVDPAEPAKLEPYVVAEVEAGGQKDLQARVADDFDNPIEGLVVSMNGITRTTEATGFANWRSWQVPTKTGVINLVFETDSLRATHPLTVTPAAQHEVTATVREDGSVVVHAYDEFGNPRVGDEVNVTIDYNGGIDLKATTVAPPEADPVAVPVTTAPVAVAAPAASAIPAPAAPVAAVGGPVAPVAGKEYTVQAGDSLWSIWESLGRPAPWQEWKTQTMEANNLTYTGNIVILSVGQALTLPTVP